MATSKDGAQPSFFSRRNLLSTMQNVDNVINTCKAERYDGFSKLVRKIYNGE